MMINILAIIVTAFIYFGIHMFWYFPFALGNKWLELVGKQGEPKEKIIRDTNIMISTKILTILFLDIVIFLTGTTNIFDSMLISLIVWTGFVVMIGINQNNFNDRTNILLFFIEYGFYLVGFIIAGIILVLWI